MVTKPGYGIIAECVANGTAMLYTSRGHFVEYDVLVREMPRFVRCGFIDQEALFAGRGVIRAPRTDGRAASTRVRSDERRGGHRPTSGGRPAVRLGTLLTADANITPGRRYFYRTLDAIGLLLLVAGVVVSITGGKRYEFFGLTLSLRSESRLFFWSAVLLLIRTFATRTVQRSRGT